MADGDRALSVVAGVGGGGADPWAAVLAEIVALVRRRYWPLSTHPAYEAADLVQDAAVQAWQWALAGPAGHGPAGDGAVPSPKLLAAIVDRTWVDVLRRFGPRSRRRAARRRLPWPEVDRAPAPGTTEDVTELATARLQAADRMARLSARDRLVLGAVGAGYRQDEIAAWLGVTASRVSQIVTAARARARDGAAPEDDPEGGR